jgi:dual specificity tyrosine-phosphorylation-regulated kinase 2/3/4
MTSVKNDMSSTDTTQSSCESGSGTTQTRFSFYQATVPTTPLRLQQSPEKTKDPTRFTFYQAESAERALDHDEENRSSVDILKSLQEHEQQRLEILGGPTNIHLNGNNNLFLSSNGTSAKNNKHSTRNPYEDALKEALELVRKLRTTNSPSSSALQLSTNDPVLQLRATPQPSPIDSDVSQHSRLTEAYQIEARRKQRQEKMAKVASRLAEWKHDNSSTLEHGEMLPTSVTSYTANEIKSNDDQDSPESPATVQDDDVQRGVERVLMAILERAGSRGRGATRPTKEDEEQKTVVDENALFLAMSDLLGTSSGGSQVEHPTSTQINDDTMLPLDSAEYDPVNASRSMDMSVPEQAHKVLGSASVSLAFSNEGGDGPITESAAVETCDSGPSLCADELDDLVSKFSSSPTLATKAKSDYQMSERVRKILSEEEGEGAETSCDTEPEESTQRSENVESALESSFDQVDESDDQLNESIDRVLGPLNKKSGGTTGVVLEADSLHRPAPGILESFSAAISIVTGGNAPKVSRRDEHIKDRYSTGHQNTLEEESSDSVSDASTLSAANDLMRSLCAHLLPVGVDQTYALLDTLPVWDEANADEPGYRIVRLTCKQLSKVEREFEAMVESLRETSERHLKNDAGSEAMFERDLKAAEISLNEEERRQSLSNFERMRSALLSAGNADDNPGLEWNLDEESSPALSSFPGVKGAGKGEMGDLEYFHLPIIFKSHVTGFEPTKDLCLEAGNVIAGQYLVEGELGTAAFSTTYKCVDLSSVGDGPDGHELVCLKVIKNTKDFFDQSLDEIKILELLRQTGQCHEKFIIEMKTFFYHREHLIIVTELLRLNLFEFGKLIVDHDQEPYFTIPRLAYITRQSLIALEFVHNLGLVHSDVKPENILLSSCSQAQVKLIDFGSSCYLTDRQSSYIQSRSYRAPEVVLGLPYDGRIDVWSIGCVVAEMYAGEVTFQNDSIVSMLSRIEAICGVFPRHMIAQGRQAGRFFTKCGLLFERVGEGDDNESCSNVEEDGKKSFDIFQPKITTLASRLGFEPDLMNRFDSGETVSQEERRQALFVDFVRNVLTIDPEVRPTADAALRHPWMQYAATLTEDEIRYPRS